MKFFFFKHIQLNFLLCFSIHPLESWNQNFTCLCSPMSTQNWVNSAQNLQESPRYDLKNRTCNLCTVFTFKTWRNTCKETDHTVPVYAILLMTRSLSFTKCDLSLIMVHSIIQNCKYSWMDFVVILSLLQGLFSSFSQLLFFLCPYKKKTVKHIFVS